MDRKRSYPAHRSLIALTIAGAMCACTVANPHDGAPVPPSGTKQPPSGSSGVMLPPASPGRTPTIVN
jgi:hypothetical protein